MAMAMSSQAWGKKKIGSWADESEAADADSAAAAAAAAAAATAAAGSGSGSADADAGFPSLSKPAGSKKKNKGQTLSLAEFTTGKLLGPGGAKRSNPGPNIFTSSDRLTSEELLYLPTGPKERSADELNQQQRLGGGFRSYAGHQLGFSSRANNGDQRFNRDKEPPMSMPPPPSRADESSDWFSNRGPRMDFPRQQQQQRFDRDAPSKADEAESWTQGKRFVGSDSWGSRRPVPRSEVSERWSFKEGGGGREFHGNVQDDGDGGWGRRYEEPVERPRLNLQPRSVAVHAEVAPVSPGRSSRPSSSHSNRPGTPGDQAPDGVKQSRVNPFGSAKPREMVLEERGQDWRKLDSEMEHKRYESEEEQRLKREILLLKDQGNNSEVKLQIEEKELELEQVIKELESKARVSEMQQQQQLRRAPSSHDAWNRPPSSHGQRSRNNSSTEVWRRPRTPSMQEPEWNRRDQFQHRPRTASGDYYNRPRTPDLWRRESEQQHNHFSNNNNYNNNESEFGKADMWSRPRTPSVHDPDEWNPAGRNSAATRW